MSILSGRGTPAVAAGYGWIAIAFVCACNASPKAADNSATPSAGSAAPTTTNNAMPEQLAGQSGSTANNPLPSQMTMPPGNTAGSGATQPPSNPMQPQANDDPALPAMDQDDPPEASDVAKGGRIYWLDILGNGVYSALPDGSEDKRIATALAAPDGIGVDDCTGMIYFSNMGSALGNSGQASVQRATWDGKNVETLVEPGSGVNTAKQLTLDLVNGHVFFADREGAKIWRMNLDGSELTQMVSGHDFDQLVGVAVDAEADKLYFSDRNRGLLLRMGLELPSGQSAGDRDDIETLLESPSGAMPIDLAIDLDAQLLYWTDRGLGTLKSIGLAVPAGADLSARSDVTTLIDGMSDPIGVSLDLDTGHVYVTEAGGSVHRAKLDGSGDEVIAQSSSGTGIAFAQIGPAGEHRTCK